MTPDTFLCCEEGFSIVSMQQPYDDTGNGWEIEIDVEFNTQLGNNIMARPMYLHGKMYRVNMYDQSKKFLLFSYIRQVTCLFGPGPIKVSGTAKFLDNLEYLEYIEAHSEH